MLVKFWGTRGSIPTPGRRTASFGGNTSCVEIREDDGRVILMDCGTGARPLGLDIINRAEQLPLIDILVTHTHWDHIQGFPFFLPAYVPGSRLTIYGARGLDRTLEGSLSGQMQHTYFPVQLQELRAKIDFVELAEERFKLGSFRVTTQFLNHTAPTMGYRLEWGTLKVVYATDHEPFCWTPVNGTGVHALDHPGEERHLEFLANADLLIHDSQYIDQEYPAKRGWGHSTIEYVIDVAVRAKIKRLALFHHDPLHNDEWVRRETERARRRARSQGSDIEIFAAAEGMEIPLVEAGAGRGAAPEARQRFVTPAGRVLIVGTDQEGVSQVREALEPDGYSVKTASPARLGALTTKAAPHLMVMVDAGNETELIEQVTRLRQHKWAADLPVIVLPNAEGPGASGRLIGGVTDVLSRPFSPSMLRARVRAWLSRKGELAVRKSAPLRHRVFAPAPPSNKGWLRGLPTRERTAFLEGALHCRFRPGEVLFREGDRAGGVYFIRTGTVRLSVRLPDGRHRMLADAGSGHTVGELAALDGGRRTATATAVEATTADYVPQDMFEASLAAAPEASRRLLRLMAARLRATDRMVAELATGSRSKEIG